MADLLFSHIALSCAELGRTEEFYAQHFGFRRARAIPLGAGNEIVFLKNSHGVYLELFRADAERPAGLPLLTGDGAHYPGVRHLAFQVTSVDDTLAALGPAAEVTLGPLDFDAFIPGWRTVWVRDPDGNIVEISQGFTDDPALATP
ncbi:VOC family protein [Hymenobacter sp. RP-2-7]|uniref:VOC family protein n=1 Tax=Hymenobacter polaris TaxID=2682546 RepID=A0A7Y0AC18_9BACT|nr:VOC family protein [Hymenobacter polaris]NML64397.1 VOC family protein [Hymenobacter polaris]